MKTSNKLLIAFASALILIPLFGMIYVAKMHYKVGTDKVDEIVKIENFATPTKNMASLPAANFKTVSIPNAKGMVFNLKIIKDAKFGVKVPNHLKDRVTISVGANGQLLIAVKQKDSGVTNSYYSDLYVYAPNVTGISVNQADGINLSADQDSLAIDIKKSGTLIFNFQTKINTLQVIAHEAKVLTTGSRIKNLTLNLQSSDFRSEASSFENLVLNSWKKADIKIEGSYEKDNKSNITNLVVNTNDQADVTVADINVVKCSGRFSDQTQVQMPAVYLNQMYNTKK